ncbi:hypothetical protein K2173_028190 [Erythroxylum novogranatense]|uniref:PHD finger protein ING n=1 Tax=Erythroxylum novogranatense TaxID=1862640 RepID=A0AAV8U537_9ROSI|nr:hypothetical protein K2173_028190 [Erythroxylum novogranatense]
MVIWLLQLYEMFAYCHLVVLHPASDLTSFLFKFGFSLVHDLKDRKNYLENASMYINEKRGEGRSHHPIRFLDFGNIWQSRMAIARTGVYVDDYLEYASTLPAELQRLLNTIRELDERSQSMINQTRQQTKYCLGLASQSSKKGVGTNYGNNSEEDDVIEKMRKEIEANQDSALSLCTEKVLLARQAHDLIDSHIKRLDEDLNYFAEDLKHEGKIPPDEPAILPPLPIAVPKVEKRKPFYGTPQSKRTDFRDRDWDRDRDFELMPPPGSHKKEFAIPVDVDQPIDPNEPTYCVCHQVSFGDMIACDNENCQGGEWFHYSCVGLTPETRFKGKWFCPTCRLLPQFYFVVSSQFMHILIFPNLLVHRFYYETTGIRTRVAGSRRIEESLKTLLEKQLRNEKLLPENQSQTKS